MHKGIACGYCRALPLIFALVAVGALLNLADLAVAAELPPPLSRFPTNTVSGAAAGRMKTPRAVAVDPRTGNVFVAEPENRRISEYSPWGSFIKAFGVDVASGPVNERQEVRVRATGGEFTLTFAGSTTSDIPIDAAASQVEAALNSLPTIGGVGGAVQVEAEPGNQVPGVTPTIFVVTFDGGSLAGTDVQQLVTSEGTTPLVGGEPSSATEVATQANGTGGGIGLEACTAESGCQVGMEASAPAEFRALIGIEVDKNGDIYAVDAGNFRVVKFNSAGDFLLSFGGEVDKATGANVCTAASGDECGVGVEGTGDGYFSLGSGFLGDYIGVGPDGTVDIGDQDRIEEFEPNGAFAGQIKFADLHAENPDFPEVGAPETLAVDRSSGALYFSLPQTFAGGPRLIYSLDPRGEAETVREVDTEEGNGTNPQNPHIEGLAVDDRGDLWVAAYGVFGARMVEYGPDGELLIGYRREFGRPTSNSIEIRAIATNELGNVYAAESNGSSLSPTAAISSYGPPPLALAPPPKVPPTITDQFATSVGSTTATLAAKINPQFFSDTRYYLEYGIASCEGGGCTIQPHPPGQELTSQIIGVPVSTAPTVLSGLAPETTYHYRFVAESSAGGPVKGLFGGSGTASEGTFMTRPAQGGQPPCANEAFRPGPAALLPDCRAYEMVSPVNKNGAGISVLYESVGYRASLDQASPNGEILTYSAYRAFGGSGSSPYAVQYLARRDARQGWETTPISPPREGPALIPTPSLDVQYKLFSGDLCRGWLFQDTETPLASGSTPGYRTLYRRDLCGGGYQAIAPLSTPTGKSGEEFTFELQGASADGTRAFIAAEGALATGGNARATQLYEVSGGHTELVCKLPSGAAVKGSCSAGTPEQLPADRTSILEHAVSQDGSTVYWSEHPAEGLGKIYVRLSGSVTFAVSSGPARFLTAATDGSRAIYSEGAVLKSFDLATHSSTTVAGGFNGLLGASESGSKVYFLATEALDGGAVPGEPNLYLYEGGESPSVTFVAVLSTADEGLGTALPAPTATWPIYHTAQVTPDGNAVVFMSSGRPTGYANADVNSGEPDTEVYLFRSASGTTICVSCLQGGARPSGRNVESLAENREEWNLSHPFWVASEIPGAENSLHTPRVIADNGTRVIFESFDPLSPRDINGQKDVYEWEAAGAGNCSAGVAGYEASLEGCVNLISSGESSSGSRIVEASADGHDVFFETESSLLPQDPGAVDIYDARADGDLAIQTAVPEPCEGDACQPKSSAPGSPAPVTGEQRPSEVFKPKTCPKGKRLVRKSGKESCEKTPKKHKPGKQKHKKHTKSKKHGKHASNRRKADR